jgi:signal transduction histidine kinase/CheY-like chemotaxis protein
MPRSREHSFAKRLTWMNMLVSGTALLLACASFIAYDRLAFRETTVRSLSMQAQIIGANSVSALLFNDSQQAENTLSALKAAHNVLFAGIYAPNGQLFASYSRGNAAAPPALPEIPAGAIEVHWLRNDEIVVVRSILFKGKPAGTVYIRSDVTELTQRLQRYAGIAAGVLAICLVTALLVSSVFRRAVAEPIVQLARLARIVSQEKNYSVRAARITRTAELAHLIDAFNDMLGQIQQNEDELRKAHDGLELRVLERTAELEAAKKEVEAFSFSILRAKEELERASKFKDQFLSTMSHELRTPLNAVLGFSELLTDERYGSLNGRQKRYLSHIHAGGKHLLSLINDILDLSKIEAGRLQLTIETVSVGRCFSEVLDTMRPLADKKSHQLSQQVRRDLTVRADPTRFKQVLMNLLANALKFTPEGGKIALEARELSEMVRVEVRDSGPGIPAEEQSRIFDAFYRISATEKSVEGTGLGLAITRRLVELHGGQIGVTNQVDSGACFYFTVPRAESAATPQMDNRGAAAAAVSLGTVLVVEDDSVAAQLLQCQLASAGYEVVLCQEPTAALDMAAKLQPNVITLDIVMKPIGGWTLLAAFKSDPRTARIPVILVTIVDQPAKGAMLTADEYIVKPVDKSTLLSALQRCTSQRRPSGKTSILVVEDDGPTREFIAELLTKHGCLVTTAIDAVEAVSQMEACTPDLVILDLLLPVGNGFELLARWRADSRTADVPVFVLTNKDLSSEESEYIRVHAGTLFQKQELWQEALVKQLQRIAPPLLPENS